MQQARTFITPFELFASTIGGVAIILSMVLIYKPLTDFKSLYIFISTSVETKDVVLLFATSYLIGNLMSGISFNIYQYLRKLFKLRNNYYNVKISDINKFRNSKELLSLDGFNDLLYEQRVSYLLSRKVNNPESFYKCMVTVIPYIREKDSHFVRNSDNYMAQHIMFRGISLGLFFMVLVTTYNIITYQSYSLNSISFVFILLGGTIIGFKKAHDFIRWHRREVVNSFYNIAFKEYYGSDDSSNNLSKLI